MVITFNSDIVDERNVKFDKRYTFPSLMQEVAKRTRAFGVCKRRRRFGLCSGMLPSLSKLSLQSPPSKNLEHEEADTGIVLIWKSRHSLQQYYDASQQEGAGMHWQRNGEFLTNLANPSIEVVIDLRGAQTKDEREQRTFEALFRAFEDTNNPVATQIKYRLTQHQTYNADLGKDESGNDKRPTAWEWSKKFTQIKYTDIEGFTRIVNALYREYKNPIIPFQPCCWDVQQTDGNTGKAKTLMRENHFYHDAKLPKDDESFPMEGKISATIEFITQIGRVTTIVDYIELQAQVSDAELNALKEEEQDPKPNSNAAGSSSGNTTHWKQYRYMSFLEEDATRYGKLVTHNSLYTFDRPATEKMHAATHVIQVKPQPMTQGKKEWNAAKNIEQNYILKVRFLLDEKVDTPAAQNESAPPPSGASGASSASREDREDNGNGQGSDDNAAERRQSEGGSSPKRPRPTEEDESQGSQGSQGSPFDDDYLE